MGAVVSLSAVLFPGAAWIATPDLRGALHLDAIVA